MFKSLFLVMKQASVAQLVEHRFRKPEVKGSSPFAGSIFHQFPNFIHLLPPTLMVRRSRFPNGSAKNLAFRRSRPLAAKAL